MHLGDVLMNFINQNNISAKSVQSTDNMQMPSNANIAAQIRALAPGQVLQGEVIDNTGDMVKLLVNMNGENVPLQARMEQSMMLAIGKSLLFQVKNNGSTLSLSPLFENMGMEQNAAKALETASIPVNATTMEMTAKLMKEGVSIDKNTLQQIYHETMLNPTAELADIIDLHKLDMPVTSENLTQMHAYKNGNHQLTGAVEQMSQDILQMVQNMVQNGQEKDVVPFLRAILQPNGESNSLGTTESVMQKQTIQESILSVSEEIKIQEETTEAKEINEAIKEETENEQEGLSETNLLAETTKLQNMSPAQLLDNIFAQLGSVGADRKALSKLVRSELFKVNMDEYLQKELLLYPEKADNKEQVKEVFNRLETQLNTMSEVLEQMGQKQSPLSNTVQNMSQNLQFLNQMNHMYAYVQLPLKLSEGNAHGELYVYSNKKHLASKDGEVSALLHLDMDHLGPVDVHVSMKESHVNTQFFLKDDSMLDFLYEHMDLLMSRLEKRGYQMSYRMVVKGEQVAEEVMNTTLGELIQENSNIPTAVNYSFDVRA